jgi:DNA polymerase-1
MFNVPYEDVTAELRNWAKSINFGLVYGMAAKTLAQSLGLPESEGQRLYDEHFRAYPKIISYMKQTVEEGRAKGYVETVFGRRRYLPDLNDADKWTRLSAERKAQNSPVQGTAADIIKLAMIRLHERLQEWNASHPNAPAHLILQVHDELVVEGPASHAEELAGILRAAMCEAPTPDFSCPLDIDLRIGKRWADGVGGSAQPMQ